MRHAAHPDSCDQQWIRKDEAVTSQPPRRSSRLERERRRHRWENVGLVLVALGVAALVFLAVATGTH